MLRSTELDDKAVGTLSVSSQRGVGFFHMVRKALGEDFSAFQEWREKTSWEETNSDYHHHYH